MSIRQIYLSSLKKIPSEEIIDLIFYRPLGFILAYILRKTIVSPNSITIMGLIIGSASGFVVYHYSYEAGALLLLFVNVLDCVDGQLARLKQQFSKIGKFLDGFADYFTFISFYFGVGFSLIREQGQFYYFYLGFAAGITTIIHCAIFDYYRMKYLGSYSGDALNQEIQNFKNEMSHSRNWFSKLFYFVTMIYLRSQRRLISKPDIKISDLFIRLLTFIGPTTIITLMVIFSFLHRIDLYFYFYIGGMNGYLILIFLFKKYLNRENKTV